MVVVERAELVSSLAEARAYYAAKLARSHEITRYDRRVDIVFERDATHLFSIEPTVDQIPEAERVLRDLGGGRIEVRQFSLERAQLMDYVLPALSNFTVSTAAQKGNRLVYGQPLQDGRYMRVALRPGPKDAWTCVSAYPVSKHLWLEARRSQAARFPP